jgi:hypothetical protein
MLPICVVNAETLARIPEDVRQYLRVLRRRIIELEQTDPQQRIAALEAANRGLQVELDDALALIARQKEQIRQLQEKLADTQARLNTNSSNSSLPPSSDRFHRKRRPPSSPASNAAASRVILASNARSCRRSSCALSSLANRRAAAVATSP